MKTCMAALVLSFLAVGCSSPVEQAGGDATAELDPDASSPGDGSSAADAEAAPPDAAAPGLDAGSPPSPKSGNILVMQNCWGDGGAESCVSAAMANFSELPQWYLERCTVWNVAGCDVQKCRMDLPDGGLVIPPARNAGTITIAGTRVDGGITLARADAGYYTNGFSKDRFWAAGDVLTVAATGGEVPAFSGKAITTTGDIVVTAPTCTSSSCGTVDPTVPLTVSWTGGSTATATLTSTKFPDLVVTMTCTFASSPGSIAPIALAQLGASADGFETNLSIAPVNATRFAAGDWDVTFSAMGRAVDGSGSLITLGGAPAARWGEITVRQEGWAGATFNVWQGPSGGPCTTTTIGDCRVKQCTWADGQFRDGPNAGPITITGVNVPGGITLEPGYHGSYLAYFEPASLWWGGETITVAAAGEGIPAFTATVVAPTDIGLAIGNCTYGDCGTISRSTPLPVTWTGSGPARVTLGAFEGQREVAIECVLPKSPAVIGPEVLAKLGQTSQGFLRWAPASSVTSFVAGDYEVTVVAVGQLAQGGTFVTSD